MPSVFEPGKNTNQEEVLAALIRIYDSLRKFVVETDTIRDTIVSLEEKMKDIVSRMQSLATTTLRSMGGGSRSELVVTFLAVLHLAREQLVFLEQGERFSDIIVRKAE
jgi:chromatin segregation and condensation protein Rec8/ScpA/Scc1 (kleisin family)